MTRASTLAAFAALCLSGAFSLAFAGGMHAHATVHKTHWRSHPVAPALGGGVSVPMDQVKIVTFSKPISEVFIGNPVIADVTMIDTKRVFVMGKTYGTTNLIGLGPDGKTVVSEEVDVTGRTAGLVTLNRGSSTFNYACSTHCETQPVPGDPKIWFDDTHNARDKQEDMSNKAAASGAGGTNGTGQ